MTDKRRKDRLGTYLKRLGEAKPVRMVGRVRAVTGLVVQATATDARMGDLVLIGRDTGPLAAEVVGVLEERITLLPLGDTDGIGPGSEVHVTGERLAFRVGPDLRGRVLDGLGEPIDGGPPLDRTRNPLWRVMRPAPPPLRRRRIRTPQCLGIRAIDGLLTLGDGQRVGLFAGAGVGKSSLMGQIARQAEADIVVIGLVGERGREVRDFLEDALGEEGRRRSVVVVATSDEPALVRLKSAFTTTAIAEYFREEGASVLLMIDSLTRFARAQRDAGLAAGELPARHGYPPSVFATLPRLLERAGNSERGTMTALYTVLVAGDDLREPIADEVSGLLDGHVVLERRLAERGHWPAIDVLKSLSRVMPRLVSPEHARAAAEFRRLLSIYESKRELIVLGAYRHGSDPDVDLAVESIEDLESFLRQGLEERVDLEDTVRRLIEVVGT